MPEEEYCVICGKPKPISDMRLVNFKQEVGSHTTSSSGSRRGNRSSTSFGGSSRPRFSSSNSQSYGTRHTTRRDYQNVRGYACKHHGRLWRLAITIIVLWIGGTVLWNALFPSQHKDPPPTSDSQFASKSAQPSSPRDYSSAPSPTVPQSPADTPHSDGSTATAATDAPTDADADTDDDKLSEISDAIHDATIRVLRNGDAAKWKAGGKKGYVVASAAQQYPDRVCRNVYSP